MVEVTVSKVEIKGVKPFPKLMIASDGDVVFFTGYEVGISLLKSAGIEHLYSESWNMDVFIDYNEELIIKNK
tara:strand:+ start:47 stop:262 length:216 start_codon:yes stop_codon:yes gene_type:complete